jgi:hypothetical protein
MIDCKTCDTAAQNSIQLEHCNECEEKLNVKNEMKECFKN